MSLQAYAILDGGGVLGAALAGCVNAALDNDIEFVGYGGTSAGSLIATLAAAGLSGQRLEQAVVETSFLDFLEDQGRPVAELKRQFGQLLSVATRPGLWSAWNAWRAFRALRSLVGSRHGVDEGKALKTKVRRLLAEVHHEWADRRDGPPDITFEMFATKGLPPLKIVASDLIARRPVVFSKEDTAYGTSVLDAVRASTCYPIVFRPVQVQGRFLVDGGLASNLPASLFHREQRSTGHPVLAFDLVDEDRTPPNAYSTLDFAKDMMATAIDAGDRFLRDVLEDVHHVEVPIPAQYSVLDFAINRDGRMALYNIGYAATSRFLSDQEAFNLYREQSKGDEQAIQRQLQALHGDPDLYEPVLAALANDMARVSGARNNRVTLMLPTRRQTRVVVYSHGMKRRGRGPGPGPIIDPDSTLEIPLLSGVSGRAWDSGNVVLGDLVAARRQPGEWGLSPAITARVPPTRRSMISIAIPGRSIHAGSFGTPLGTLTLDTSTDLANTSWKDGDGRVNNDVQRTMQLWANVVRQLLLASRLSDGG